MWKMSERIHSILSSRPIFSPSASGRTTLSNRWRPTAQLSHGASLPTTPIVDLSALTAAAIKIAVTTSP